MSHACCGPDPERTRRNPTGRGAAGWLALAASPTFAVMGLLTAILESGPAATLCSGAPLSPLTGMATMYLLMGAFHAAPWLKLIRGSAATRKAAGLRIGQ